ncbi:MAG: LPS export ABC transporter periplasmic protein LptC, partial [Deltaproteobacteria bacterium]|nr:LPS export ABC transporter periplasmic protein LptC [Deltaproteobacteria bacterium]
MIKRFLTGFFCLALTGTNVYSFEDLKITSDQAVINEYSNSLTLLGNVLIKRLADGVTLKSESLIVNRDENNQRIVKAEARGNVVLEEPGRSLSSQKIYFDRLLHQIDLTGHVIVSSENYLLRGDRFSYDYKEKQGKLIP